MEIDHALGIVHTVIIVANKKVTPHKDAITQGYHQAMREVKDLRGSPGRECFRPAAGYAHRLAYGCPDEHHQYAETQDTDMLIP